MTYEEACKICKLLDIQNIWLENGLLGTLVKIKNCAGKTGYAYVYPINASMHSPAVRMLHVKGASKDNNLSICQLLKILTDASAAGLNVFVQEHPGHWYKTVQRTTVLPAYKTVDELLVEYDLKFTDRQPSSFRDSKL